MPCGAQHGRRMLYTRLGYATSRQLKEGDELRMGFSGAVLWWEEWQLHVLVLTSLFLQCFLFFAGVLRKRCIPSWLRFLIWLSYIGSDAVPIYALAILFNSTKKQEWAVSTHHHSSERVLWVPILLVHLGGQDGITAYNIEDNELWKRHVVTAVSQVSAADGIANILTTSAIRFLHM